jgi:hypothetical protein
MTRSENIMSRWWRMKQESAKVLEPDDSFLAPKSTDAEPGDLNGAAAATPGTDFPTSPPFDPASLPPLQSITVGTDIRSFLGSSVPVELKKAALRRAWATDPAFRDCVVFSERHGDYHDPTAMPGFGPLRPNDVSGFVGLGKAEQARRDAAEAVDAQAISDTHQIDEIDLARAQEYALLAALLSHSPDAQMIEHLSRLRGEATQLGAAHAALSAAAASMEPEQIER